VDRPDVVEDKTIATHRRCYVCERDLLIHSIPSAHLQPARLARAIHEWQSPLAQCMDRYLAALRAIHPGTVSG